MNSPCIASFAKKTVITFGYICSFRLLFSDVEEDEENFGLSIKCTGWEQIEWANPTN